MVHRRLTDVLEHRLERGEISMNVVESSDPHGYGAGGAIVTPSTPLFLSASATNPEAFASSMNARRYSAPASRPLGTPAACAITMNRSSSTRDPGIAAAAVTRACLTPAMASSLSATNRSIDSGDDGARTICACFKIGRAHV